MARPDQACVEADPEAGLALPARRAGASTTSGGGAQSSTTQDFARSLGQLQRSASLRQPSVGLSASASPLGFGGARQAPRSLSAPSGAADIAALQALLTGIAGSPAAALAVSRGGSPASALAEVLGALPRPCTSGESGLGNLTAISGASASKPRHVTVRSFNSVSTKPTSSRRTWLADPVTSKPQTLGGEPVWPEYWGITQPQLRELLAKLRAEPDWDPANNVHVMVQRYIIPWTRGTGTGYSVMVNGDDPKEVGVMVSHAWGENAEEFLDTLIRTCSSHDVLFICALGLYQCEDGAGPSIAEQIGTVAEESPFRRILEHIACRGREAGWRWHFRGWLLALPWLSLMLTAVLVSFPLYVWDCVPFFGTCAAYTSGPFQCNQVDSWTWRSLPHWPLFSVLPCVLLLAAIWLHHALFTNMYAGRMIVALNREVDIYSRLWCVYEIFVAKHIGIPVHVARTLAAAGKASVRNATCSCDEDMRRIRTEIEATTTFDAIDTAVYITSHKAWWKVVISAIVVGSSIALFDLMFGMTFPVCPERGSLLWLVPNRSVFTKTWGSLVFVAMVLLAKCSAYYTMLSVFSRGQGAPTVLQIRACSVFMMIAGSMVLSSVVALCIHGYSGPVISGGGIFGLIWAGYGSGFWAYGLVLRHFSRSFRRAEVLYFIICACVLVFFQIVALHLHMTSMFKPFWRNPDDCAHFYRIITNAAAGSFGSFFLPTYIFWHTARWWGFQVKR